MAGRGVSFRKPRIYIAGPMTGVPEFNHPAFRAAAKLLRGRGYVVENPAENFGGETGHPYADYMRAAVLQVLSVDAMALLPGWKNSNGARMEVAIGRALGLGFFDAQTCEPLTLPTEASSPLPDQSDSVLHQAHRLVHGERGEDYDHPIHNFARTGRMWGAILGIPDVPPETVGLCMVAVKLAREAFKPKADNRIDGSGYFETVDMIHRRRHQ
jgi:hypothetical protein